MEDRELLAAAEQACENAYAPYSHFQVGAALLTVDGQVFTGCNVENASFGAACCAERVAVGKAISEGCRDFLKIAVANSRREFTPPCGICRQVLLEFMPEGSVVLGSSLGEVQIYGVKELLPAGFVLEREEMK